MEKNIIESTFLQTAALTNKLLEGKKTAHPAMQVNAMVELVHHLSNTVGAVDALKVMEEGQVSIVG